MKVDAGADFIITQLFYDVDHFLPWYKKVRQKGECVKFMRALVVTKKNKFPRYQHSCDSRDHANSDLLLICKGRKVMRHKGPRHTSS